MDQLLQDIENLEKQKTIFLGQLLTESNETTKQAFEQEIAAVERKLAEKQGQLAQLKQQRDEIVSSAQDPQSAFSISSGGFTADFRTLAAGEDEYQMLSITTQLYIAEQEKNHIEELKAIEDSYKAEIASAQAREGSLEDELSQTRIELSDARTKLDNAMNQLTDAENERDNAIKEAESLRKQLAELREQLVEKPSTPTNVDGSALADIQARLDAKKPKIYNVQWGDTKRSYYTANLAETGEPVTISWTQIGKYKQVTEEEAGRFRDSIPQVDVVTSPAEVVDVAFPTPPTIPEHILDGEVAEETVGEDSPGESFEEEIRRRMARVESALGIAV